MVHEDKEKTFFISNQGLFYHKVMPFDLKNVRTTYQQLVIKIFRDQIDQNIKVYVDDMLIKHLPSWIHVEDIEETFATLW